MTPVFDPFRLAAVASDVVLAGHATPQGIAARQTSRLARLLTVAQRDSRLYREWLKGKSPAATALVALPVVTRGELQARFDDWVTDPRLKLDELRAFTADASRIGTPFLDRYVVWESSGTSGQPGIFVQDAQAMAVYDALEALRRCARPPLAGWLDPLHLSERTAFVGAIDGHFASYVTLERLRQLNPWLAPTVRSFSILQPTGALVQALNAFAPTVIATYPTAAALLADEAAQGRLHVKLREIWTGGETLSDAVRSRVSDVLGCRVKNSYGASEFLAMGWECDEGRLHLNADWVILEPVDEHHRPVPPGEPSFTVLLTHLANTVQPLIRYDLGDQITLPTGRCACGSSLPVMEVQGRRDDPLTVAGRDGRPVTLLPLALMTVLEDRAGVFDFQLRQHDDRTLVLRLGLQGAEAHAAMSRGCAALKAFALAQGAAPIEVREELGQPVPRGRSGKARRVIAIDP
ncbi:MAG: AMP-binding protein [Burkholderiaceae bacterium]|nr:AMP-binding protein [Burkholderiaceae bacterium]MDZ4144955.1 AMP-binding protein [Burkholderiales bacterium]